MRLLVPAVVAVLVGLVLAVVMMPSPADGPVGCPVEYGGPDAGVWLVVECPVP